MGHDLEAETISDVLRAQRHFDDMLRRMTPESLQPSFDIDATDETESTSNLSVYSDQLYDENTFESYLLGEILCVAMEQDEDTTSCDSTSLGSRLERSFSQELKQKQDHCVVANVNGSSWRYFLKHIVYAACGAVTFTIYAAIFKKALWTAK